MYIEKQKLKLIKDFKVIKEYIISTSAKGIGNEENSQRTPVGRHCFCGKIGEGAMEYLMTMILASQCLMDV